MKFEVISLEEVRIDGAPAGKLVDVLLNYRDHVAEIYVAAALWAKGVADQLERAEKSAADATADKIMAEQRLGTVVAAVATLDISKLTGPVAEIIESVRSDRLARRREALRAELGEIDAKIPGGEPQS